MKKLCLVILALLLISCSKNGNNNAVSKTSSSSASTVAAKVPFHKVLTPQQVMRLIGETPDLLIVDVRSPRELKEGKLQNSVLVPFWNIMRGDYNLPKNRTILLYCAVGGRSYAAMQIMARKGYPKLYNLKGGIAQWKKEGLPVVY
ncbi:MAG TPA: rhodanese-like domain-containing protein [Desulfobacterales bacterium]|nr:rhodanese-like domain-containing protein [Desulfobacterales bacterium]